MTEQLHHYSRTSANIPCYYDNIYLKHRNYDSYGNDNPQLSNYVCTMEDNVVEVLKEEQNSIISLAYVALYRRNEA